MVDSTNISARPKTTLLVSSGTPKRKQQKDEGSVDYDKKEPELVGSALLKQAGKKSIVLPIDFNGNIFTIVADSSSLKLKRFGHLNLDGQYQLNNGDTGNILRADSKLPVESDKDPKFNSTPIVRLIDKSNVLKEEPYSEVTQDRRALPNLTGKNIPIDIIEVDANNSKQTHWQEVASVAKSIAPNANIQPKWDGLKTRPFDEAYPTKDGFNALIGQNAAKLLNADSKTIEDITEHQASKQPHIINISQGDAIVSVAKGCENWLEQRDEKTLQYLHPAERRQVYGNLDNAANSSQAGKTFSESFEQNVLVERIKQSRRDQLVLDYVNKQVNSNKDFQTALAQWQAVTHKAAQQGNVIVVAAGNENGESGWLSGKKPNIPSGAGFNFLGKSLDVISVASANTNGDPKKRNQYKISDFSSRGDGVRWNPTVAAQGENLVAHNGDHQVLFTGTSGATPVVSGIVAVLREKHPDWTPAQIREALIKTAIPAEGYDRAAQGSGIINPAAAVNYSPDPAL